MANEEFCEQMLENKLAYARSQVDQAYSIYSFDGTFAITDHARIAEPLKMFLMLSFGTARLERVDLDKINELLNEVWHGPGSMETIFKMEHELNKTVNISALDMPKFKATKVDLTDAPLADASASASDFNFEATLD